MSLIFNFLYEPVVAAFGLFLVILVMREFDPRLKKASTKNIVITITQVFLAVIMLKLLIFIYVQITL